ncbi:MAG TPA: sigma-70 family RNA polymerase sigma factor [Solirubrobacteraceae bacterium]|nr:sigma-70 family RNA polymerase sigma factor [Solirubrobacteraceae bacterium]
MEASALRAPAGLGRLSLPSALLKLRSDEQLVALFRAGNDEAFRVIHDRYRQRLFAYVRQMLAGSRSDAEDALQDVFLRAYNALRADERPVALKAWLYRVAHNRCIDQLRRPVPAPADVFDLSRPVTPDPLAETERRDDLRRLVADVQQLPEQQRSALLMRELEGLTYADLSAALDVSVPAVKSLLVRARIGLVEAAEARDTACVEIQDDLALSFGKGVRASAKARRHMRECQGCRAYRSQLRGVRSELGALLPGGSGPFAMVAKLFGLGAGASGGGAAVVGGGAAAATTAKVAALVCCAAVVGGGAVELRDRTGTAPTARGGAEPAAAERERRVAPERMMSPTPIDVPAAAPALRVRTESARPKAVNKGAARRLRKQSAASAAWADDPPITSSAARQPATGQTGSGTSGAGSGATTSSSTGGSAGPAETEPATAGPTASSGTQGSTGSSVTAVVAQPSGTSSTGSSPTATTASTSGGDGSSTQSGSGTTSSGGGTTTTSTSSSGGSGGR